MNTSSAAAQKICRRLVGNRLSLLPVRPLPPRRERASGLKEQLKIPRLRSRPQAKGRHRKT